MPNERSSCRSIASGTASKKAGHPHPLSNLLALVYSGASQPAHVYTPRSLWSRYAPVPARSVPFSRSTRNCSGLSTARHSDSVLGRFVMVCRSRPCDGSQARHNPRAAVRPSAALMCGGKAGATPRRRERVATATLWAWPLQLLFLRELERRLLLGLVDRAPGLAGLLLQRVLVAHVPLVVFQVLAILAVISTATYAFKFRACMCMRWNTGEFSISLSLMAARSREETHHRGGSTWRVAWRGTCEAWPCHRLLAP